MTLLIYFLIFSFSLSAIIDHLKFDTNGYSIFEEASDTIKYYISTDGDDTNDGLTENTPFATIQKGYDSIRDTFPDWMLLKRGDTFAIGFPNWQKGGRSDSEPQVIKSYGSSKERPVVEFGFSNFKSNGKFKHIVLSEIKFFNAGPTYPGSGIDISSPWEDFFIEDVYFGSFDGGGLQDRALTGSKDLVIRHCIVVDSYSRGGGHCQGLFMYWITNVLIENNFFDHNGWEGVGLDGTMFNHNIYLVHMMDLTFRNNIFIRASSINVKMLSDEEINPSLGLHFDNNYFGYGEVGIGIGGNTFEPFRFGEVLIENNVFSNIGHVPTPSNRFLGWMLPVSDNYDCTISNNLFVNNEVANKENGFAVSFTGTAKNILVKGNTMADIVSPVVIIKPDVIYSGFFDFIENNIQIHEHNESSKVLKLSNAAPINFKDNNFYSNEVDKKKWFSDPFPYENGDIDKWFETTNTKSERTNFPYPKRNIDTYAGFLGLSESTVEAFTIEARKQSKFNYRKEYSADELNKYVRQGYGLEYIPYDDGKNRKTAIYITTAILSSLTCIILLLAACIIIFVLVFCCRRKKSKSEKLINVTSSLDYDVKSGMNEELKSDIES